MRMADHNSAIWAAMTSSWRNARRVVGELGNGTVEYVGVQAEEPPNSPCGLFRCTEAWCSPMIGRNKVLPSTDMRRLGRSFPSAPGSVTGHDKHTSVPFHPNKGKLSGQSFGMKWNETAVWRAYKLLKTLWPGTESNRRRQPFQGRLPIRRSGSKSVYVIDLRGVVHQLIWDHLGRFGLVSARGCTRIVRGVSSGIACLAGSTYFRAAVLS
jgi:hypothetical protein